MISVSMESIEKRYPNVVAVDHVDFQVLDGEIHCLLGENGAGKTTLMKILYGMTQPDSGTIQINGTPVSFKSPLDAIHLGIGMVHQHFQLAKSMSVADNVVANCEQQAFFRFSPKKAAQDVEKLVEDFGFNINPSKLISELSVGEQQRVEIIKALYRKAKILILDEPTAVLTPSEVKDFFKIISRMRDSGNTIIIITHKLKEAIEISDHVSVMRNGKMILNGILTSETTVESLTERMIGRHVIHNTKRAQSTGAVLLDVQGLNLSERNKSILKDINLQVRSGEIHGIAGVEGNGQTELIEVLTGLLKPTSMDLTLDGKPFSGDANDFLRKGVGHVPEDRKTRGLVGEMSVMENLILGYQQEEAFSRKSLLKLPEMRSFSKNVIKEYEIKATDENTACATLSGGNQQKVIIGRVICQNPSIIIVAQPTRGVDVGSQEFIHHQLFELRDSGAAILLFSADLDELLYLSDTVSVIYEGQIVRTVPADTLTETEIGRMMLSGKEGADEA